MPEAAAAPSSEPQPGESMAARLARQRQQRSMLRTSNLPLEDAAAADVTPSVAGSELQILRSEVAESGATISRLQTQLKQSEAEMEEIGSKTARMAEELRMMRERADAQLAAAAASGGAPASAPAAAPAAAVDGPMSVSISLPDDPDTNPMDGISVHIKIATSPEGAAAVSIS